AQLNSHRPERETLTNFIETSFLNNPAHASKMKEAIKLHFNKLIVVKPEFLEMNINLMKVLFDNAYFKNSVAQYESLLKNLADQIVKSLSETTPIDILEPLMQMVRKCKKPLSEQLEQKLFTAIDKKLNIIIIQSNALGINLERNIDVVVLLKGLNYFNSLKRNEELGKCKRVLVVQFQNICKNAENVDALRTAMLKVFTVAEMRIVLNDLQVMKSLVQNFSKK
nr:hypothetical protein [Parachlamydiaceae bacterium]